MNDAREHDVDAYINKLREARQAVPGATQEVPKFFTLPDGLTVGTGQCDLDVRELTRDELRWLATQNEIKGRGSMNKDELIAALEALL